MLSLLATLGPYAILPAMAWLVPMTTLAARRNGQGTWVVTSVATAFQPLLWFWLIRQSLESLDRFGIFLHAFLCFSIPLILALNLTGLIRTRGYRDEFDVLLLRRPDAPSLATRTRWRYGAIVMTGTLALSAISVAGVGARTCGWLDRIAQASGCAAVLHIDGPADGMAVGPNGTEIAVVASFEEEVRRWDLATGRQLPSLRLPGETEEFANIEAISWSVDGKLLATGGDALRIWDAATGKLLRTLTRSSTKAVLFLPDGMLLAGVDYGVDVWPVAEGLRAERLPTPFEVYALDVSPDGMMLAAGGYDTDNADVLLWDLPSRQRLRELPTGVIYDLAFSPNSRLLATAGSSVGPTVWLVDDGMKVWTGAEQSRASNEDGDRDFTSSVVFSPDGTMLASGTRDGLLTLWLAADGTPIASRTRDNWIRHLVWTAWNGGRLVVGLWNDLVELWHVPWGRGS
jgi:WD40 repeat protein